jgi:hypothetical protein
MAKQLLQFQPVFTPGAANAGTLDFTALPGFSITKLYAVINDTRNVPLYIAGAPTLGYVTNTSQPGTVVTLQTNTTGFSSNDILNIYYDTAPGNESNLVAENNGNLQRLLEVQIAILTEMKITNLLLLQIASGLNIPDDLDAIRSDLFDNIDRQKF